MSTHAAWASVSRMFAGGTPVLRSTLSPGEVSALPMLGKAVRPTVVDQSFVLCSHCQQHRAQVWSDGRGGRICRCPDCGQVPVEAIDGVALALDEDWLRQKMRLALEIESRDDIDDLGDGAWRLGDTRRSLLLLARDLTRVLHEPNLLDRVRVAGSNIRVITPRPRTTRGSPFSSGVGWLALEERFTVYGDGITFIPSVPRAVPAVADPATPIRFTQGQAKVFEALWLFKGAEVDGERIIKRVGQKSDKPIDLFKIKLKDKGKLEHEA